VGFIQTAGHSIKVRIKKTGALFHAKMTEEAIDYFKEAIRIRPGFAAAQKNLETVLRSEELE